jgi:hypothetical protein
MLTRATSLALACMLAACAPTYAPHIDAPSMPELDSQSPTRCTSAGKIAPLENAPHLPDLDKSMTACPAGSGFVSCFTPAQEAIRQRRFKLLHDDRDYCRDAYEKAVKRDAGM